MDPTHILEILRNTETGIGFNTVLLLYITYLQKKVNGKLENHETRISVIEAKERVHQQIAPQS